MRKMEAYLFKILKVKFLQIEKNPREWSENNLSGLKSRLDATDEIDDALSFYFSSIEWIELNSLTAECRQCYFEDQVNR